MVFRFRSVKSIVIPAANTGRDNNNNTAVIFTAHTKRGIRSNRYPLLRIFITVEIKLAAPKIEDAPAR